MAFSTMTGVFSDAIVTAKELNRQPGRILDLALEGPVTITRNSETFALMPRENVTSLIQAAKAASLAFEVTTIAHRVIAGEKLPQDHPYAWLEDFDKEDLDDFIHDVTCTFEQFSGLPNAWVELDGIIHEWHESALVYGSSVLDKFVRDG